MATHETTVTYVPGRYPYKPSCSCGWTTWGYVAEHAAAAMARDHQEGGTEHRLRTTWQEPAADSRRYPTHFGWECTCGEQGWVKAKWGTGESTTRLNEAHAEHAAAVRAAEGATT